MLSPACFSSPLDLQRPTLSGAAFVRKAILGLLTWLMVPRLFHKGAALAQDFPDYLSTLQGKVASFLGDLPEVQKELPLDAEGAAKMPPHTSTLLSRLGQYSLSLLGFLALLIIVVALVLYAVAKWVVVFYIVMNEIMGNLVMPRVRASTMGLHPVSVLFVMLAMAAAFGIAGALIATALTAFIKAYYEEFYLARQPPDPHVDERVESMLKRQS